MTASSDVRTIDPDGDGVGIVELCRPPENYLTIFVLWELLAQMRALNSNSNCGAIIVRSRGKHFCAGRDWGTAREPEDTAEAIYATAPGFLDLTKPWIAELTGGSIGVGMGLAMCADYRVAADSAYLWAKFVSLGIHHGFGLTATLPWAVGNQRAMEILSTGRRVSMDEAATIGLVDRVSPLDDVSESAHRFAVTLASQPPLALASIKATMRNTLLSQFESAIAHERRAQTALYDTDDFQSATGGGYRYA